MVVLLLLSLTLGLASELGAGEKEKNTFEPLLSTSGNRSSILWGKIGSLCIMGAITLCFSMISLWISFKQYISELSGGEEIALSLSGKSIALTIVFSLLLNLAFADPATVSNGKIAILVASLAAVIVGFVFTRTMVKRKENPED